MVQKNNNPLSLNVKLSLIFLISVNLISIIGVIFWGWNTRMLLLAYWAESAIIGFFTILKMLFILNLSKKTNKNNFFFLKIYQIVVFLISFIAAMFVHLAGIYLLVVKEEFTAVFNFQEILINLRYVILLLVGMIFSHTYSFSVNYIKNKEYEKTSISNLMTSPFHRIIIMQFAVIVGAGISLQVIPYFLGISPENASLNFGQAIVLIVIKILFDINAHIKEHTNTI